LAAKRKDEKQNSTMADYGIIGSQVSRERKGITVHLNGLGISRTSHRVVGYV